MFFYLGQKLPDMTLIRQHLMLEGVMDKSCLIDILHKITGVFSKFLIFKSSKSSCETATETIMESYQFFLFLSDHRGRAKLIEGPRASYYYWRHPWTVLWYDPHVWESSRPKRHSRVSCWLGSFVQDLSTVSVIHLFILFFLGQTFYSLEIMLIEESFLSKFSSFSIA